MPLALPDFVRMSAIVAAGQLRRGPVASRECLGACREMGAAIFRAWAHCRGDILEGWAHRRGNILRIGGVADGWLSDAEPSYVFERE